MNDEMGRILTRAARILLYASLPWFIYSAYFFIRRFIHPEMAMPDMSLAIKLYLASLLIYVIYISLRCLYILNQKQSVVKKRRSKANKRKSKVKKKKSKVKR